MLHGLKPKRAARIDYETICRPVEFQTALDESGVEEAQLSSMKAWTSSQSQQQEEPSQRASQDLAESGRHLAAARTGSEPRCVHDAA